MISVIPTVLTGDLEKAKELIKLAEGNVERIQVDVVDGVFADKTTIRPSDLDKVRTELFLDYHLMVDEPIKWVEECIRAGVARHSRKTSSLRIIGHIEKMNDQVEFVNRVKSLDVQVGLAVDLSTPVTDIEQGVFVKLDVVLVMSVPAGHGGQEFDEKALRKLNLIRDIRSNNDASFRICDDGGITIEHIDDAHFVGADEVAIGRSVYKGNMKENIKRYQDMAHMIR